MINHRDDNGVYQLYLGVAGDESTSCITCSLTTNGPAVDRHKLQPHWHPSGDWIAVAGEREIYDSPWFASAEMIVWAEIGAWHPNGREISALNMFFPTYETWTIRFG